MNNTGEFMIGTTKTNPGQSNLSFFYLEPGSNLFRVLPPMFSLAQDGHVSKYWATHRGFRNTKGKQRTFRCLEEKNKKSKQIEVRCPICDAASKMKELIERAKANGASKEQVESARKNQLTPLEAEKMFWLNVINVDGKIGVLPIKYKQHEIFKNLLTEQFAVGFDPTSMNGCYLNFKKVQAYKGDPQTTYTVEIAYEQTMQNGVPQTKAKMHTLTPEIIERMKAESRDLAKLFPSISVEQAAILIQLSGMEQAVALEKFLGGPEKEETPATAPNTITVPGTTAQAVISPVQNNGQLNLTSFGTPAPIATPVAAPVAAPVFSAPAPVATPAPTFQMPTTATTLPAGFGSAAPAAPAPMTDADFVKMFQPN